MTIDDCMLPATTKEEKSLLPPSCSSRWSCRNCSFILNWYRFSLASTLRTGNARRIFRPSLRRKLVKLLALSYSLHWRLEDIIICSFGRGQHLKVLPFARPFLVIMEHLGHFWVHSHPRNAPRNVTVCNFLLDSAINLTKNVTKSIQKILHAFSHAAVSRVKPTR